MKERLGDYIKEYSVKNKSNEDIPVYSVTNTQGFCNDFFGKEVASKDKTTYKIVPRGYFAYNPSRINVGSVDWQRLEDRVIVSPLYNVFSVSTELDQQYLYYYLKSDVTLYYIKEIATGSVRDNLKLSMLNEFPINIPSLEEQKQIVKKLDKLKRVIELRQKEIEQLEGLIKARFVEMFGNPSFNPYGYPEVKIPTVVSGKVSNGFFVKRDEYVDSGNVSVLGVAYTVNRMYSQVKGLPKANADQKSIQKYAIKYGDMLFCRSSIVAAGIGKASIVPEEVPKNTLFECHVIRLPLDLEKCVPEYMQTLSTMDYFRNQIIAQAKTATMTTIGQDGILKANIILPPLEIQKEFYRFVKQVDKSKITMQKSLNEYQLLFDSLVQQYFG